MKRFNELKDRIKSTGASSSILQMCEFWLEGATSSKNTVEDSAQELAELLQTMESIAETLESESGQ